MIPHVTVVGIYRSPTCTVPVGQFCSAIRSLLVSLTTTFIIFIGDFNVNWLNVSQRKPLYNWFVRDRVISNNLHAVLQRKILVLQLPCNPNRISNFGTFFSDHTHCKSIFVP